MKEISKSYKNQDKFHKYEKPKQNKYIKKISIWVALK